MISKVGSRPVSRVLSRTVIHLRRMSPYACSDLPGSRADHTLTLPYLVLLRVGFTLPLLLPATRCALTAPFHPCRPCGLRRCIFCGTFRGLSPPRCYLAPCPVEPGLSSASPVDGSDCPANSRGAVSAVMGRFARLSSWLFSLSARL